MQYMVVVLRPASAVERQIKCSHFAPLHFTECDIQNTMQTRTWSVRINKLSIRSATYSFIHSNL